MLLGATLSTCSERGLCSTAKICRFQGVPMCARYRPPYKPFGTEYQEFQHSNAQHLPNVEQHLWHKLWNLVIWHLQLLQLLQLPHQKCCEIQLIKIHTGMDSVSVFTASPETKSMNQSAGFSAGGISKPRP